MLLSGPDCQVHCSSKSLCSYMSMQLRTLFGIGMTAEGSLVRFIYYLLLCMRQQCHSAFIIH